jgi:hypothetical protein
MSRKGIFKYLEFQTFCNSYSKEQKWGCFSKNFEKHPLKLQRHFCKNMSQTIFAVDLIVLSMSKLRKVVVIFIGNHDVKTIYTNC